MSLDFVPITNIQSDLDNKKSIRLKFRLKSLSLLSKYNKEYFKDKFLALSFAVIDNQQIVGYVVCTSLEQVLRVPNSGIKIA